MNETLILISIPLFFISIAIEWMVQRARKIDSYDLPDTIADLGGGVGQQLLDPLARVLQLAVYAFVLEHFSIHGPLAPSPLVWAVALVGVDFFYYWYHRSSHRIGALWAVHEVHHQSPRYNLAVALRQPWLEKFVDGIFYLPLAIIGVPMWMYLVSFSLNLIYQFFLHTRVVGKLGPLEILLNTPSHHRVHHGINPQYIDRNYGGVLILWDKLFGTFEPEKDTVVFGLVQSYLSADALHANVAGWKKIAKLSSASESIGEKVYAWIAPPEWRPRSMGGSVTVPEPTAERRERAPRMKLTSGTLKYLAAQLVVTLAGTLALMTAAPKLGAAKYAVGVALSIAALAGMGAAAEQKSWTRSYEIGRLIVTSVFVAFCALH